MEKLKLFKIFSNKYVALSLILVSGFFIGWLVFHPGHNYVTKEEFKEQAPQATIWTCAMHPQIRMDHAGKCPICGMDLIPLKQSGSTSFDQDALHLTPEAMQLANVQTSVASKGTPVKEIRLYGKVEADERLLQNQVAHLAGRIENLTVNFTGESIVSGQILGQIYSPELITAQQELLEAAKTKDDQPAIYEAAREKLRQWKLGDKQITDIEASGSIRNTINIISNTSGIVVARRVNKGDYVSQGTILFDIADLSKVWVMFDAYESDLQFIRVGEEISFTVQAFPGNNYSGKIIFIDPLIDPVTRVAKVRAEVNNGSGIFKPGMFVTGVVSSRIGGKAENLVIPRSAVLWTGKRSIVYVKQKGSTEPVFKMREIELGPVLGDSYVVTGGLAEGEEIVTNGTFSVDAASQLEGKPSMMNPRGGKTSSMPGMIMPGDSPGDSKSVSDTSMSGMDMSGNMSSKMPEKLEVSMDFIMQLNTVFDQYIILKNAYVQSDVKKVKRSAQEVQKALSKVDMKLLTDEAHLKWMDMSRNLNKQIKQIISADMIEDQRMTFSEFSNLFYTTVKTFGLMGESVYYQYCPMAFNNKGAYWLSEIIDIRNPYFGKEMINCGETKETLNY